MRIGVDLGGTKCEAVLMADDHRILARQRLPTPADYAGQLRTIQQLVWALEQQAGRSGLPVGVGHPGAVSPASGLIKNANSACLNGQPLQQHLQTLLARPVRLANDANCLAVSEATDGAAQGAALVFAVILGTGVGGGIALQGRALPGRHAIAGEWGHNPLPWPRADWGEVPGPLHWDGRHGAIEAYCSGSGLARDHQLHSGQPLSGEQIVAAARSSEPSAQASLSRHCHRLARALASVVNLLDPDVIVLGGGLSALPHLYTQLPLLMPEWVFSDAFTTPIRPALHGDSSGVRGAAWLTLSD